ERSQAAVSRFCQEHGLGYQFNLALQVCMYAVLENDEMLLAQFAHWLGGGGDTLPVDPNELSASPSQPKTRATKTRLTPLGFAEGQRLVRLVGGLVDEARPSGLGLGIAGIKVIACDRGLRRTNNTPPPRARVDQSDENLTPPSACPYLAATPETFDTP